MTDTNSSPEAVTTWTPANGGMWVSLSDYKALFAVLTQSRAETAAAYERAAVTMGTYHWNRYASKEEGGTLSSPAVFTSHTHQHAEAAIRALATPDQSSAIAAIEAAAEARGMRKAAVIAYQFEGNDKLRCAILAAIPQEKK